MKRANEVAAREVGMGLIDLNVISAAEKYIIANRPVEIRPDPIGFDAAQDTQIGYACQSCAFRGMNCYDIPCEAEDRPDGISVHFVKRPEATPK